jgi:hypothetical protein
MGLKFAQRFHRKAQLCTHSQCRSGADCAFLHLKPTPAPPLAKRARDTAETARRMEDSASEVSEASASAAAMVLLKDGTTYAIEDLEPTVGLEFAQRNPRKAKLCTHSQCRDGADCTFLHLKPTPAPPLAKRARDTAETARRTVVLWDYDNIHPGPDPSGFVGRLYSWMTNQNLRPARTEAHVFLVDIADHVREELCKSDLMLRLCSKKREAADRELTAKLREVVRAAKEVDERIDVVLLSSDCDFVKDVNEARASGVCDVHVLHLAKPGSPHEQRLGLYAASSQHLQSAIPGYKQPRQGVDGARPPTGGQRASNARTTRQVASAAAAENEQENEQTDTQAELLAKMAEMEKALADAQAREQEQEAERLHEEAQEREREQYFRDVVAELPPPHELPRRSAKPHIWNDFQGAVGGQGFSSREIQLMFSFYKELH